MRGLIMVFALAVLAGCTSVRPMYSAPGEKRFAVECPTLQPKLCEKRARSECDGAFRVLAERDGTQGRSLIVDCR